MTVRRVAPSVRAANPMRGEVELALGERTLVMRPTFQALVAAEAEVGSLSRLVERAATGDVRLQDVATLFWHCAAGDVRDAERATFEGALVRAGIGRLLPAYRLLLTQIYGGG